MSDKRWTPRWPDRIIKILASDLAAYPNGKETAIMGGKPGVVVAVGTFDGFEIAGSVGEGAVSSPIGRKTRFANRTPLVIVPSTPTGVLKLAFFDASCHSYEEASWQAEAWAGEQTRMTVDGTVTTSVPSGNIGSNADLKSYDVAPNSNLYVAQVNGGGTTVKYRPNADPADDRTLGIGVSGASLPWQVAPGQSFGPIYGDFYFASADGSGAEVEMELEFYEVIV